MTRTHRILLLIGALVICALIYAPGLGGSYEFDDFPNIVDNEALHVDTLSALDWEAAIWSSPSSDLQRPLASLTLAANYFFTGLAPLPMKVTNLVFHLINGILLFILLRAILGALAGTKQPSLRDEWIAVAVTSIWLVHPINLTAVLYVVQRMESLAQTFVLIGLIVYVRSRLRERVHAGAVVPWRRWVALPACLVLGVGAKESAVLLPLYALIVEWIVFRFRDARRSELAAFYAIFLLIPGLVGIAWLLPKVLHGHGYDARDFTLAERLMTEPRVLMDYLAWILLPIPSSFSFFRDDFAISTSLLHPWTTLPAMAWLLAIILAGCLLRARRPLVALGLLWFVAAHVLTASFIPLEIAFEHRNYFASAAILMAAVDLAIPRDTAGRIDHRPRVALVVALGLLSGFTLLLRSKDWSDPVRLAFAEVHAHPESPRAAYSLGRTLVILSGYRKDSPNIDKAFKALEGAARMPGASLLPDVALMTLASRTGRPVEDAWWDDMVRKASARRPTAEDTTAIASLTQCQREGHCVLDDRHTLSLYLAALNHDPPSASIMYSYAIFAYNRLHDTDLAVRLAREATSVSKDPQYRVNLANFLLDLGRIDEARVQVEWLESRGAFGGASVEIARLRKRLATMTREKAPSTEG